MHTTLRHRFFARASSGALRPLGFATLLAARSLAGCGDDATDSAQDTPLSDSGDPSVTEDAAAEDAAALDADLPEDAGLDVDAATPEPCAVTTDCAEDEFCHEDGHCRQTVPPECAACTAQHPCDLANRRCDCSVRGGDVDNDGYVAKICGGDDCDDGDKNISPSAIEICDFTLPTSLDTDEDCEASTIAYKADGDRAYRAATAAERRLIGDADGDGWVSDRCTNRVSANEVLAGSDCADNDVNVHKHQTEACNGYDDNCNDLTDELADQDAGVDQPTQYIDGGLLQPFYPDVDGDEYGAIGAVATYFCPNVLPPKMVSRAGEPSDPDDANPAVHPGATELCDGVNNTTGASGDDLPKVKFPVSIPLTRLACAEGAVVISECPSTDVLWCGGPVADGCSTDGTALKSCHACTTDCKFGCGSKACDSLADLRVGSEFTCALSVEGRVACWGNVGKGRLGHQTTNRANVPMWLPRIERAQALVLGEEHACAVVGPTRELWCWGANASGQLGTLENLSDSAAPLQVRQGDAPLSGVSAVSAGAAHTCAITQGAVNCWGTQADGKLGNRTTANSPLLGFANAIRGTKRITDATAVGVGRRHTCILSGSVGVECWGDNSTGQLGLGTTDVATFGAHAVLGLPGAPSVLAVGSDHACSLHGGRVYCWGDNSLGRLGPREASATANGAAPVLGLEDVTDLAAGGGVTCAFRATGGPVCWGSNRFGQLAVASGQGAAGTLVPLVVGSLADIARVRIGSSHACAIASDGTSSCWGSNNYAELGAGRAALEPDLRFALVLPVQGQGN